jgi:hypothetical protein
MNVFVLNTGRCGSSTFIQACKHITNYTSAHESLSSNIGQQRLNYPANHIEADNRLSWFLGRLENTYGDNAFYVHLKRNINDTVNSFSKRIEFGIMRAYEQGVLMHEDHVASSHDIARDYIETVNSNIDLFLKGKSRKMDISLETITSDFPVFWERIQAVGDFESAIEEWRNKYNAS